MHFCSTQNLSKCNFECHLPQLQDTVCGMQRGATTPTSCQHAAWQCPIQLCTAEVSDINANIGIDEGAPRALNACHV